MAQWVEVTLRVDGEAAEATAELLRRYGYQGVVIEQDGLVPDLWDEDELPPPETLAVRAYLPLDERVEETKRQLETALGHMSLLYPMPTPVYNIVNEEDWAEAWKKHYHPLRVGRRLLIRPRWIFVETSPDDLEIALDPGMAFGTGTHPSTQLALEALEDRVQPGMQVLDLGCGSAILSIAAVRLGAAHVWALDIDPVAVKVSLDNVADNGLEDRITVQQGSLETVLPSARRFDVVAINILPKVIISMAEQGLAQIIRPGGYAILSGILTGRADDVEDALIRHGLEVERRRVMGDWTSIEARRPQTA